MRFVLAAKVNGQRGVLSARQDLYGLLRGCVDKRDFVGLNFFDSVNRVFWNFWSFWIFRKVVGLTTVY